MAFTSTNPVGAVGDPMEKVGDIDVLRANHAALRDDMIGVQHVLTGTGSRSGRHYGLAKYSGSGTLSAGAAETNLISQVDADFTTGLWEAIVFAAGCRAPTWLFGSRLGAYTEHYFVDTAIPDLSGTESSYSVAAPSTPYVKYVWAPGSTTLTLAAKPTGGASLTYRYAIIRWSK